jgi:site-specific recombinase XerD
MMSSRDFAAALRLENLGERTIEEYVAVVDRWRRHGGTALAYVQSLENPGSRMVPLAALRRWAQAAKAKAKAEADAAAEKAAADTLDELVEYHRKLRRTIPKAPARHEFSSVEAHALARAVEQVTEAPAERFALRLLLRTGARASDVSRGVTRQVLEQALNTGVAEIRTKGRRTRDIDFSSFKEEIPALLKLPRWQFLYELLAPSRYGFKASVGRGYTVLDHLFKSLCVRAGVSKPWITHRCRHTVASAVYRATKDPKAVVDYMGWSGMGMLDRYLHGETVADISRKVAASLSDGGAPKAKSSAKHFRCPYCGPHVKSDEDGCCAFCGADCVEEACQCGGKEKTDG